MRVDKSPYLKHHGRLADIITAIQVMGTYPRYTSRGLDRWKVRLGNPISAETWETIINDHPEFFRKRTEQEDETATERVTVSLNWRWSFDRNYSPERKRCLTDDEMAERKTKLPSEQLRLTKSPLSSEQTEILINTAIRLHDSAISNAAQKRWWIPLIIPAITALIGAIIGFYGSIIKTDNFNLSHRTPTDSKLLDIAPNRSAH